MQEMLYNTPHEGAGVPELSAENHDWFLAVLVEMVNLGGITPGITLFVGGAIISGQLIGADAYFEEFARSWDTGVSHALGERPTGRYAEMFQGIADTMKERASRIQQDDDEAASEEFRLSYLHLRNARVFLPGSLPMPSDPDGGILWRGRLSAVDGFTLGLLGVAREDLPRRSGDLGN